MKANQITVIFLGLVIVFTILYDIFTLFFFGGEATLSYVINQWGFQASPLLVFGLGSIFGGLFVHFFKWAPLDKQVEIKSFCEINIEEVNRNNEY